MLELGDVNLVPSLESVASDMSTSRVQLLSESQAVEPFDSLLDLLELGWRLVRLRFEHRGR